MTAPLHNEMHEQFCQSVAHGSTYRDAVRAAGFKSQQPWQQGRLLMMRDDVKERVAALKAEIGVERLDAEEEEEPTVAWVTKRYTLAIRMAREREDRSSMIKGLDSIAKLRGYMVDRVEQRSGPHDGYSPDDLALVIELAAAAKQRRVIEAEMVVIEAPRDAE